MSVMGAERGLRCVLWLKPNLMKPRGQIELGEDRGRTQFVEQLVDGRQGEAIFDCNGVPGAIINAHAPRTVLILEEKHRGQKWAVTGWIPPVLQKLSDLRLDFDLLSMWIAIRPDVNRGGVRAEGDGVISEARRW